MQSWNNTFDNGVATYRHRCTNCHQPSRRGLKKSAKWRVAIATAATRITRRNVSFVKKKLLHMLYFLVVVDTNVIVMIVPRNFLVVVATTAADHHRRPDRVPCVVAKSRKY